MPEPKPSLFDSHAHLDAAEFDPDRPQVMLRARAAGVGECLVPAVSAAGWTKLHELCAADAGLHPAYGLHPCFLPEHSDEDLARLEDWLVGHPAAAVGECGLDSAEPGLERQLRLLRGHFDLAHRFDLPLVLHARQAFAQVIDALRAFGKPLRGVVHSFSGSLEQAHELARLGFSVGIGAPVTYERARRLRRTVASLPIECLLLETDAPDQPSSSHRGERNEPAYLPEVLECIAALRREDPAEIARATTANARGLFA
ncbi:MAG TPA: TatD family hydrolase [Rhodanobacteraceae bacterium]|jgi:TatD DNase family protein|nr:TatD family hydrolase [Rhodanobacteraceae bacterium]